MKKNSILSAFNKLSHYYEHSVDHTSPFNADYERPAMTSLLGDNLETKDILDAGCAAGWYTEFLLDKRAHVTAVDLCSDMVMATNRRCKNKARVFQHDLMDPLPIADESFDMVFSSLALHFIEDWAFTLKEFSRVIKEGGALIFSVVHPSADLSPFQSQSYFETELVHEVWEKNSEKVDIYFYRRSMQKIFSDTSLCFTMEQVIEPQPNDRFRSKDSEMYQKLMTGPHFLIVKAQKKALR